MRQSNFKIHSTSLLCKYFFFRYDEIVKVFMIPLGREQIKKKIKKKRDLQEKKRFSKNGNKLQFH